MYCNKITVTSFIMDGTGSPILYLYANELVTTGEAFDFDGTSDTAEFYIYANKIIGAGSDSLIINTGNYKFQVNNSFIDSGGLGFISENNSNTEFINCVFKTSNTNEFDGPVSLFNSRNYDGTIVISRIE